MSEFILKNEYLLHNSVFIRKKGSNEGFMNYMIEPTIAPYFQELFNYIKPYIENIHLIVGKKENLFTKEYASDLTKYIFVLLLRKIVEFIKMDDDDSDCKGKNEGNEIYQSLEEMNISELSEKNKHIWINCFLSIINSNRHHTPC